MFSGFNLNTITGKLLYCQSLLGQYYLIQFEKKKNFFQQLDLIMVIVKKTLCYFSCEWKNSNPKYDIFLRFGNFQVYVSFGAGNLKIEEFVYNFTCLKQNENKPSQEIRRDNSGLLK